MANSAERILESIRKLLAGSLSVSLNPNNEVSKPAGKDTYRVVFAGLAAPLGVAVEIIGAAARTVRVVKIHFSEPSVAQNPLIFAKNSAAATGGTSTTPTPVPMDSNNGDVAAVIRLYTVAPTPGAAVGKVYEANHATAGVLFETFGETPNAQSVILRGMAEALTIVLMAAATINGYIEWTEE